MNLLSKINSNIKLKEKEKVHEVDVPRISFLVALKEIDNADDSVIKDNYNGDSKSVRRFLFEGNSHHENVELKPLFLEFNFKSNYNAWLIII